MGKPLTLAEAQTQSNNTERQQAFKDLGVEYNTRPLVPPSEDKELQEILARESEFARDERISADTQKIDQHLAAIDTEIDTLIYGREITESDVYALGLLTLLRSYWLEKIELGDKNPLAQDLLKFHHLLDN